MAKIILLCISKFNISYRIPNPLYIVCYTLITLASDTSRPFYRGSCANLFFPIRRYSAQVIGEYRSRT